ncbi:MAG: CPBP family intramembrane metalloprotease [Candidatus Symbiothrix sp.]|jgi:membrane protease YdiL (CAAX protease family)|nr:CPBP family intramembrane metalloprotease [Candidatus Symbiothrix sp.]
MKFLERALDGQNQFWKYAVVCLGGYLGGQLIGSIPLLGVLTYKEIADLSKNTMLFLLLLSVAVSLFCIIFLIKVLHNRSFAETVNGRKKIRTNRIWVGALVWAIVSGFYLFADCRMNPENYTLQFDLGRFIPLLIITFLLIPLQTTSEELLFRGYLAQGIGGWTKNRWAAFIVPGILFGLLHIANPEVKEFGFWLAMPQYVFFGLLFGIIAVLDDGIELPIGMHAVNNMFACLFTTHPSSALQTDAVFLLNVIDPMKETVILVLTGMVAFSFFAVKYQWKFGILNKKITYIDE